jgi:hypothetical protein
LGEERRAICRTGAADDQFDEPAAQAGGHHYPRGFAGLGLTADLHDDALAFVQPFIAWENLALRQEGGPIAANIDERRAERRHQLAHPAQMNAPSFTAVAALDIKFNGHTLFEQRRAPLARARRYQQLASQPGRYPRPASSWTVSKSGRPTTLE